MTVAAKIGTMVFDDRTGEIKLPGWKSQTFVLPGSQYTGVHLIPPVATESELTLTRFGNATQSGLLYANQKDLEATDQYIILGRVDYSLAHQLKFHIVEVTPVMIEEMPHASGHRNGSSFSYTPACKVVTKWRVLPVPS